MLREGERAGERERKAERFLLILCLFSFFFVFLSGDKLEKFAKQEQIACAVLFFYLVLCVCVWGTSTTFPTTQQKFTIRTTRSLSARLFLFLCHAAAFSLFLPQVTPQN